MSDTQLESPAPRTKTADEKFCADCGAIIALKAEICPKCGVRQKANLSEVAKTVVNTRSKLVAALLALFLGGIGIHKFYLGKTWMGILYLLFCWTFIPALVAFIEAIILFAMSDEKFNAKYGSASA